MNLSVRIKNNKKQSVMTKTLSPLIPLALTGTLLGGLLSVSASAATPLPRIIGGTTASDEQFPWQAAIIANAAMPYDSFTCGGSIINANWILTAAHCAESNARTVVVGTQNLNDLSSAQKITVKRWIKHPDYVDESATSGILYDNDIALIELLTPIDMTACGTKCATISLADSTNESSLTALSTPVILSGWGETTGATDENQKVYPNLLQWAQMNIVDCSASPSLISASDISASMMCATVSDYSIDACSGDSGGPLVTSATDGVGYVQVGVVSFGYGCATPNYPGVYTRVAKYAEWIYSTTDGACCTTVVPPTPIVPGDKPIVDPVTKSAKGGGGFLQFGLLLASSLLLLRRTHRRNQH